MLDFEKFSALKKKQRRKLKYVTLELSGPYAQAHTKWLTLWIPYHAQVISFIHGILVFWRGALVSREISV